MRRDNTEALLAAGGCGLALAIVALSFTVNLVIMTLAYHAAEYFGFPGYLGVLVILLGNCVLAAIGNARRG